MSSPPPDSPVQMETQPPPHDSAEPNEDSGALFISDDDEDDIFAEESGHLDDDVGALSNVYNENDEPYPEAAAYDDNFLKLPGDIQNLLSQAQEAVTEEQRNHSRYQYMFGEAERLRAFPSARKRRINIVGKSGAGKSSLLNCVLGRPDAAKALAAGKGCTHVPTSYEAPFDGQITAVAARVVFFSESEIRQKLKLMLNNYNTWHFTPESARDWPPEENQQVEDGAQTAFDAFRSLFCEREEFSSEMRGEKFLITAQKESEEKIINRLAAWCQEVLPELPAEHVKEEHCVIKAEDSDENSLILSDENEDENPDEHEDEDEAEDANENSDDENEEDQDELEDDTEEKHAEPEANARFSADSMGELRDMVETYAFSSSTFQKISLWPLVRIVKVGMAGIDILQHVSLVDWPGADDTNQLRANACADRIYDCDEMWIVSSAARICTEPTVIGFISRYSSTVPCVVICTQIDANQDEELVAELKRQGYDTSQHDALKKEEKRVAKALENAANKLENFRNLERNGFVQMLKDNKRRKINPDRVRGEITKTEESIKTWSIELPAIEQQRLEAIIQARKRYISSELQGTVDKLEKKGATLKLRFVSNEHYMARKGAKKVYGPVLSLEASGIPELRTHIRETAAVSILGNMQKYVNHKAFVFLEGIKVLVNPGNLGSCEKALEMVRDKKSRLEPFKSGYLDTIKDCAETKFAVTIKEDYQEYRDAALEVLDMKRKWAYASLRAFVRQNGCHETPKIPWHSWNEQFLEAAAEEMLANWADFVVEESANFEGLQKKLAEECQDVVAVVGGSSAQYRLPGGKFQDFIQGQIRGIDHVYRDSKAEFKKQLGFAMINATQADGDNPTGFFNQTMEEVWEECKTFKGAGTKKSILTAFEMHLKLKGERSPFVVVANSLVEAITDSAEQQAESLVDGVEDILDNINNWLEAIFNEPDDKEDDEEIRSRLQTYLVGAEKEYARIKDVLNSVEGKYKSTY